MTTHKDAEKAAYCLLCDDTHENSSCKTSTGATIRKLMDERDALKAELERLRAVVEAANRVAVRHSWHPDVGQCVCSAHKAFSEALAALERGGSNGQN